MNTELPAQAVLTSCSRTKQGLLALFTADGFLFSVDEETFAAFHLAQAIQNSSPLAGGELAALAAKSESAHAKQTALRLVGARRHAAAELYRKLCQKYDDRAAAWAVAEMQRTGWLDDREFARARIAALVRKQRSRTAILHDLAAHGVDRELAREVLDEMCEEESCGNDAALEKLLEGAYLRRMTQGEHRKVQAALARRGFGCGEIRRAMDAWRARHEYETDDIQTGEWE
ncbi:MAG TPA: recombination regulator RecX [Candidatus Anaerofilum faecale]|nr:recombination regulator RecX [Candidatus Anaerofilum faecale]